MSRWDDLDQLNEVYQSSGSLLEGGESPALRRLEGNVNALVRGSRLFHYKSTPDVGLDLELFERDMADQVKSGATDEEMAATMMPLLWPTDKEKIDGLLKQGYRVVSKDPSVKDPGIEVWLLLKEH